MIGTMLSTVGPVEMVPLVSVARKSALSDEPFTFEELARRWSVSVDTVRETVPPRMVFRVGKKPLVRPADVLRIEEGKR